MQPRVQEARERYRNSVWTCRPRLHCRNKLLSGPDPGRVCWLQLHLNFILNKEQSFTTVGLRTSLCVRPFPGAELLQGVPAPVSTRFLSFPFYLGRLNLNICTALRRSVRARASLSWEKL